MVVAVWGRLEAAPEEPGRPPPVMLDHSPLLLGDLLFCNKRGAYARSMVCGLRDRCPGAPGNQGKVRRLTRMRDGRGPVSNKLLGEVRGLGSADPSLERL